MIGKTKQGSRASSGDAGKRALKSTAALVLGAMSCVGVAAAQETPRAPVASESDEILVTARRREEDVQTVPAAITVVGSETLEDFHMGNIEDLTILEPSLTVSGSSGRPNSPVYSLRGIRPTESIYGQDPTVAIYMADVVQSPAQGSNLGFYDLQNVQVLKGPQGTLFGRNTIGGAILLTPRAPGDEYGADLMLGAGSFGLQEAELGVDMPLADALGLRFAVRASDSEGYQTNVVNGSHLGGEHIFSWRLTADVNVGAVENTTILYSDDLDTNGRGTSLQATNPLHSRAAANPLFFVDAMNRAQGRAVDRIESDMAQTDQVEAIGIINTTTIDLGEDLTFKAIASYREVESMAVIDLDASSVANILTSDQTAELDHGGLELQLLGSSFGGRLDWVTGAYYYNEKGFELSPGFFFGSRIIQRGDIDNSSYSIFAQGSLGLTEDLTLTVGGRMNRDERKLTRTQQFGASTCLLRVDNGSGTLVNLPIASCQRASSDAFEQPTGTISLDYQATPDLLLYATSRLGYRSGGFNLRGAQPVEYAPFDPETVIDLELGAKADWNLGGWDMRTNVAVFQQQYDDIQRTVAVPTAAGSPGSVVVNAAAATGFGVELQQTIRPTDNLTFQFNYAYNDASYDEWIDPASGTDLSATPFAFTPENSGNIMVRYDLPLGSGNGDLNFTVNAAYTGDMWINPLHTIAIINAHPASVLPLLQQEAYWLLDVNGGWESVMGSDVDLTFYVRNVADEEYKVGGIQLYTGASGFIAAAYGPPRTAGMQLRVHF